MADTLLAAMGDAAPSGEIDSALEDEYGGLDAAAVAAVSVPAVPRSDRPLISVDDASRKLGPEVLAALEKNFNGSLTAVRYPDENDRLF